MVSLFPVAAPPIGGPITGASNCVLAYGGDSDGSKLPPRLRDPVTDLEGESIRVLPRAVVLNYQLSGNIPVPASVAAAKWNLLPVER
jgi:hypothetical protein